MPLLGIDTSSVQGRPDWQRVARAGVRFAIAKATDGPTGVDPSFASSWSAMGAAAIVRGAYHFAHPRLDPLAQARHFAEVVGGLDDLDLPPALDLEVDASLGADHVLAWTRSFVVEARARFGRSPLIYTGVGYWMALGDPLAEDLGALPLWVAHYTLAEAPTIPRPWKSWTIWQRSGNTIPGAPPALRVDGINGEVDADLFAGGASELHEWIASTVIAPPRGPELVTPMPDGATAMAIDDELRARDGDRRK